MAQSCQTYGLSYKLVANNFVWAQFFLKLSIDIQSSLPRANGFPVSLAHHVPDT